MSKHATRPRKADPETPALLAGYFARIDKGSLLTHAEEVDPSRRARTGDKRARQRLIENILRTRENRRMLQEVVA